MANLFSGLGGQGGQAAPMAPAPMAPAAPTGGPFTNLFSPDSPSRFVATIGTMMGNPSREELQSRDLGAAQGGVLNQLTQAMQQGRSPQQALMDLMSTDEGIDYFTKGGDVKSLVDYLSSTTPPAAPEGVLASPGSQLLNPQTGSVMASVPTAEVQEFEGFANLAALSNAEKTELARAQLYADQTGDKTQQEAAVSRMINNGLLTPEQGDFLLTGIIGFETDPATGQPRFRNMLPALQAAAPIGAGVAGTGLAPEGFTLPGAGGADEGAVFPSPQAQVPGQSPYAPATSEELTQQPTGAPSMPQSGDIGDIDPLDITSTDARIIRGAGWFRDMQSTVGNVVGPIIPALGAPVVQAMTDAMQQIKVLTNQIPVRAGSRLATDIKELQKLSDYENKTSVSYGGQLFRLHDMTERLIKQAEAVATSPSASLDAKKEAEAQIFALSTLLNGLPAKEDLRREIDAVKGEGGQLDPFLSPKAQEAIEGLEGELGVKGKGNKQSQTTTSLPTFKSEQDVWKAVKEGKVKDGDRVIVNGKELPVLFEQ